MRALIIVKLFPFLQLAVERRSIIDDYAVQQRIELLLIDTVRSLYFPIETWRSGLDIDMLDAQVLHMIMKVVIKFRAVVRLDHIHSKRQT